MSVARPMNECPFTIPTYDFLKDERDFSANFTPLNEETLKVLKENVFDNKELPPEIKEIQTFAKKVTALKNMAEDFESGKIKKERARAIGKCVGVALLVVLAVAFTLSSIVMVGAVGLPLVLAIINYLPHIGFTVLGISLLIENSKKAHRLMKLTAVKVHRDLHKEVNKNFSAKSIQELTAVERRLVCQVEGLKIKMSELRKSENRTGISDLAIKKVTLELALKDVSRLCEAIGSKQPSLS